MKTYDFKSREKQWGRIVFALSLNLERMNERIVIGEAGEVRRLLNGGDGEVYYDEVCPLGSFFSVLKQTRSANGMPTWQFCGKVGQESRCSIRHVGKCVPISAAMSKCCTRAAL